jgi:glycosyltransferase involved in cell wall biosynthesis
MNVSVVVPVKNEEGNVRELHREIAVAMRNSGRQFEIIFVDDGSTDGTYAQLRACAAADPRCRVLKLRRNYGQTVAMKAGIDAAVGEIIVTLDGDRQNDPADIPEMLNRLDDGFDVVLGVREVRQDALLHRRLPSVIANRLFSMVSGVRCSDLGCALKAIRADFLTDIELYGEMHRYLGVLLQHAGARCTEVRTNHRPRVSGRTKYGLDRTMRVLLDLLVVKYRLQWFNSPMRLFGSFALASLVLSFAAAFCTLFMKLRGVDMTGNPLLLLTVMAAFASLQLFSLGILSEVCARVYFHASRRSGYAVAEQLNAADDDSGDMILRRAG